MSTTFATAAWPACTSALRLDRWLAGELSPAQAEVLRAHVDGCARCAAAASELRAWRDGERLPPLRMVGTTTAAAEARPSAPVVRLSRRRRVLSVALGGLAAAAGLAVMLRGEPPADRLKGRQTALAFGVYVLHDGAVRRAGPGEVLAPGDALRFAVQAPEPGYVAVLSLDPAGRASIYYPAGGRAEPVAPGAEIALPLATRLDATLGEERIFALFCDGPVELEPVRAALEGAGRLEVGAPAPQQVGAPAPPRVGAPAPPQVGAPAPPQFDPAAPAGCQVTGWRFEKR